MHNNTILFWDQIQMIESIDLEMIAHFIDQKYRWKGIVYNFLKHSLQILLLRYFERLINRFHSWLRYLT